MSKYYCQPYNGDDPFLFISYSHIDYMKVETILNILHRRGFRIWYDKKGAGIDSGNNWLDHIHNRIDSSHAFLGFISSSTEFRQIVLDEITRAIEKREKDPNYKVILLLLDRVSPDRFPPKICDEMKNIQYIDFQKWGGITEEFVQILLNCDWPIQIIAPEYRDVEKKYTNVLETFDEIFKDKGFLAFNQFNFTEKESKVNGENIRFYAVSPDDIDQNTVYPIVMDNQWIPTDLLYDDGFFEKLEGGLYDPSVARQIIPRQRNEIFRSLLHNWQIVVNRASIENSKVFSDWYCNDNEEYEAFKQLLSSGSVILYLMREYSPVITPNYGYNSKTFERWKAFCKEIPVFCLRFDWDDSSNKYESTSLLGYVFQNFCMTTVYNQYRMEGLMKSMNIPDSQKKAFVKIWKQIHDDVVQWNESDTDEGPYRRDRFYKNFIVKKETDVENGIIDINKPFARELKQIIDFNYCTNLPLALQIQPLIPKDSKMNFYLLSERTAKQRQREIGISELICAVSEFEAEFIPDKKLPVFRELSGFNLDTVWQLRQLKEWAEYMRAVTEGKQRSQTSYVDLYSVSKIWERYQKFIAAASEQIAGIGHMLKKDGALSVTYSFEGIKIITVYLKNKKRMQVIGNIDTNGEGLNRKTGIAIDIACGDVLENDLNNVLLTEIRLFEGITHDSGTDMLNMLIQALEKKGFCCVQQENVKNG